jgi:hypothetical protein
VLNVLPNFIRDQGWFAALHGFFQAIIEGREPESPPADLYAAAQAFAVVTAAKKSLASGRMEAVPSLS